MIHISYEIAYYILTFMFFYHQDNMLIYEMPTLSYIRTNIECHYCFEKNDDNYIHGTYFRKILHSSCHLIL